MHELSLIERVLEIAAEEAVRGGSIRIHRIVLRVGPLAGVVPEALEFAFEVARSSHNMAAGAMLEVEMLPLRAACGACGLDYEATGVWCECPGCGRADGRLEGGREIELASLEVS